MIKEMNCKKILTVAALCAATASMEAKEVVVKQYAYAGPYAIATPYQVDETNVKGEKFADRELLNTTIPFGQIALGGKTLDAGTTGELTLPGDKNSFALHLVSFYLNSDRYVKGSLTVKGPEIAAIYVDGEEMKPTDGKIALTLEPHRYEVVIKYLSRSGKQEQIKSTFETESDAEIAATTNPEKRYFIHDVLDGEHFTGVSLSPSGKYLIVNTTETFPGGKKVSGSKVVDSQTGQTLLDNGQDLEWLPKSDKAYYTKEGPQGKRLIIVDPVSKTETILSEKLPDGRLTFAPTEDYLILSVKEEGPKENEKIRQILVPDDRQPGWRDRVFLYKYDLANGLCQRLTFGHTSTRLNDISADGRQLLFSCSEDCLTERPFNTPSIYRLDLASMRVDTLIRRDKFVNYALFSPDGKQLLVHGSGEAFGGIGLNIKKGQTSNLADGQLFLFDIATKEAEPLTKTFNPSVGGITWSADDNQVYFTAENRDYVSLYRLDPANGDIRQLPTDEDVVENISLASHAPRLAYYGMSVSNSQRLYTLDLKALQGKRLIDLSEKILKDVTLGEVKDWNFVSAKGDTIYGRFYLPPHFDPGKKYPLIVNYYGGTSPTERSFESRYPTHAYAALGYVVYILQPSGATGFGQEFSARHVNAWGKMTADEIIEGTKRFCKEHTFIDSDKIGCIGASYGGFMTQYLQTKTDIFAAAISHAGISDITSYWGEGYWGYSYSALATANSYPWNARDLYTLQSPLFNADKINTPLLFLHGTADTNVPVGESIQMFTALKLLGKTTEFVQVPDQDHHILDYDKRILWTNTIFAWFAKWLKGQPEWWDALYPPKTL